MPGPHRDRDPADHAAQVTPGQPERQHAQPQVPAGRLLVGEGEAGKVANAHRGGLAIAGVTVDTSIPHTPIVNKIVRFI